MTLNLNPKRWGAAALLSLAIASPLSAQIPVTDVAHIAVTTLNTESNVLTQIGQITQIANELQQIAHLVTQIEHMLTNLELSDLSQLPLLTASFARLGELLGVPPNTIGHDLATVLAQFDQLFNGFEQTEVSALDALSRQLAYAHQMLQASRVGMRNQAVSASLQEDRLAIEASLLASDAAPGNLAALQAGNQMRAVLGAQQSKLMSLMAASARVQASQAAEQAMQTSMNQAIQRRVMEDFEVSRTEGRASGFPDIGRR
jgi:P-type conjugative transfer protein TrbJ